MAPPYLPLFTDPWVASTRHLSRPLRCLYHDLLVEMWRTPGCRVPNDDAWLGQHLSLTPEEVANELRPIVREFCQTDGNWITQKRLKKEYVFAFQRAGRLGALHKRRKNKGATANGSRSSRDEGKLTLTHTQENLSSGESQQPPPVENPEPPQPPPKRPDQVTREELNAIYAGWSPAGTRKPHP